jgi:hypothetical protein
MKVGVVNLDEDRVNLPPVAKSNGRDTKTIQKLFDVGAHDLCLSFF